MSELASSRLRDCVRQDWNERGLQRLRFRNFVVQFLTDSGFLAVLLFRCSWWLKQRNRSLASRLVWRANIILNGCDLSPTASIGPGLHLPHPVGVVVGNRVVAGRRLCLFQGVTLGARADGVQNQMEPRNLSYPTLGDDVVLYPYVQVLGGVRVGDRAVVLANAVLVIDAPEDSLMAGVPARILEHHTKATQVE